MRDCAGNITFNQGVYFTGDPARLAQRGCRNDETSDDGEALTYDGRVEETRDQYIIAGRCEEDTAIAEQWYTHHFIWDFSLTLLNATTFFHYGEHLNDPMNPATWQPTNVREGALRIEITSYPNPAVRTPLGYPLDRWWCLQAIPTLGERNFLNRTLMFPYWSRTGAVSGPGACPAGTLPQYNASTMPPFYGDMPGGNTEENHRFDMQGVTLPN